MIYIIEKNIKDELSVIDHVQEVDMDLFRKYTQNRISTYSETLEEVNKCLWTRYAPYQNNHIIFYNDYFIDELYPSDEIGHLLEKLVTSYKRSLVRNLKIDSVLV